jgi:hypothetical protein
MSASDAVLDRPDFSASPEVASDRPPITDHRSSLTGGRCAATDRRRLVGLRHPDVMGCLACRPTAAV